VIGVFLARRMGRPGSLLRVVTLSVAALGKNATLGILVMELGADDLLQSVPADVEFGGA
jgi:hypothetical protein